MKNNALLFSIFLFSTQLGNAQSRNTLSLHTGVSIPFEFDFLRSGTATGLIDYGSSFNIQSSYSISVLEILKLGLSFDYIFSPISDLEFIKYEGHLKKYLITPYLLFPIIDSHSHSLYFKIGAGYDYQKHFTIFIKDSRLPNTSFDQIIPADTGKFAYGLLGLGFSIQTTKDISLLIDLDFALHPQFGHTIATVPSFLVGTGFHF